MNGYFVTGAMGFVGSHWCEYLLKKGKKVYGLDLGVRYQKLLDYDNFVFIQDTIKNYPLMENIINRVDCVCHFAGVAEPDQYVESPRKVIDVTAIAGLNLIEMCRVKGKLFFYTSTSEIYGKNTKIPFSENDDRVLGSTNTNRWCYSSSKALMEHYLNACAQTRELDSIIVRLFNVYGPRLQGRAVSNFINLALTGEEIIIHGDGKQTRAFTYIDDVIDAFYKLITNKECINNIYNVGNPIETSIEVLAKTVLEKTGNKSKSKFMTHTDYYGESYEDIGRRVPDISRIKKYIGWEPTTSLEDGIGKTVDYYRK